MIAFDDGAAPAPSPTESAQSLLRVISELTLIASEALTAQLAPARQSRLRQLTGELHVLVDRLAPDPNPHQEAPPPTRTGGRRR